MKILLSPSEGKHIPSAGGFHKQDEEQGEQGRAHGVADCVLDDEMWGGREARNTQIKAYLGVLESADDRELCKVFGTKVLDMEKLQYCCGILTSPRIQAIRLYSGVAYKALDFAGLDSRAQEFVLDSVLITSNLFGLVRAGDGLPFYHLNQKYQSKQLSLAKLYKAQQPQIDMLLSGEEVIIDLRAQVYIKAYPIRQPHYTLDLPAKVSHQAKHHRGVALRKLAMRYSELAEAEARGGMAGDFGCAGRAGRLESRLLEYVEEHFVRVD